MCASTRPRANRKCSRRCHLCSKRVLKTSNRGNCMATQIEKKRLFDGLRDELAQAAISGANRTSTQQTGALLPLARGLGTQRHSPSRHAPHSFAAYGHRVDKSHRSILWSGREAPRVSSSRGAHPQTPGSCQPQGRPPRAQEVCRGARGPVGASARPGSRVRACVPHRPGA